MSAIESQRDLLVSLQRSEFARAAQLDLYVLFCQAAAGLFAVLGLFFGDVAPLSLLLAAATLWFTSRSRQRRIWGEKARRATLLVDGFGLRLSAGDMRRFFAASPHSQEDLADWNDPKWFASAEIPGAKRAADLLEESAFWSTHLFEASAEQASLLLAGSLLLTLACFTVTLRLSSNLGGWPPLRVFATVAASIISVEFLTRASLYRTAARSAAEIIQRIATIRQADYPKDDLLLAFADYNSIVETAPMMAPGVYARNQKKLNDIWAKQLR